MEKWVKVTLIILGILLALSIVGYVLYNHITFKKMGVCISNENPQELMLPCSSNAICFEEFIKKSEQIQEIINNNAMPNFLKEKMMETIEKSLYCDVTCKMKKAYGDLPGAQKFSQNPECLEGEEEIKIEIRGKEAIEILMFIKENPEILEQLGL